MKKYSFLLFVAAVLFFTACKKDTSPLYVYDIKDEFNIELYQGLSSANTVIIKLSTVDSFPDNYQIDADLTTPNNRSELNVYQLIKPTVPSPTKTILTKEIRFEEATFGSHPIDFIIRNSIVNQGVLLVGSEKIELDFSTKGGLTAKQYEVNRIPPNSYWGLAYVQGAYHKLYVDKFLADIKVLSSPLESPLSGNYGYFSIQEDGQLVLPPQYSGSYTRRFLLTSEHLDKIDSCLQAYKALNVGFHARILTSGGQVFHHVTKDDETGSLQAATSVIIQSR